MDGNVSVEDAVLYDTDLRKVSFVAVLRVAYHLLDGKVIIS